MTLPSSAKRRRLLPDLSIVVALVVAVAVSGITLLWVEQRISALDARMDRELRISAAMRSVVSTGSTDTATTGASGLATETQDSAVVDGTLVRFTSMSGSDTTLEAGIVYVQRVDGDSAAAVAALYGDAPTNGTYVIDTGERTATMTVAIRTPVRIVADPVPGSPAPADAAALAAALRGENSHVWERTYFLIERSGAYITSITQADAPLRSR